jgi:hypothetical protein
MSVKSGLSRRDFDELRTLSPDGLRYWLSRVGFEYSALLDDRIDFIRSLHSDLKSLRSVLDKAIEVLDKVA